MFYFRHRWNARTLLPQFRDQLLGEPMEVDEDDPLFPGHQPHRVGIQAVGVEKSAVPVEAAPHDRSDENRGGFSFPGLADEAFEVLPAGGLRDRDWYVEMPSGQFCFGL